MNFKKIWTEEPIGLVALAFSILSALTPLSFSLFNETFFYADNYDIRCGQFSAGDATVHGHFIYQNTSCIITNNSGSDISIVGVKPTIFNDKYSYPEFAFPMELKTEPQPIFFRRGESKRVEATYYALITEFVSSEPFEKCIPVADFQDMAAHNLRPCYDGEPQGKSLLQNFYEGVQVGLYDFNRSGLTIEIGDGREFYYQPELVKGGFLYPADSTEYIIQRQLTEDTMNPKKWASVPGGIYRFLFFTIGYIVLVATWMLTKWLYVALRNSYKKYSSHQEGDNSEKLSSDDVTSDKNQAADEAKTISARVP